MPNSTFASGNWYQNASIPSNIGLASGCGGNVTINLNFQARMLGNGKGQGYTVPNNAWSPSDYPIIQMLDYTLQNC
jgi:hypothetical protein